MKKLKLLLVALGAALLLFAGILVLRAGLYTAAPVEVRPAKRLELDEASLAGSLSRALQYATVSREDGDVPADHFAALRAYLAGAFPRVHAALAPQSLADHSLLFTWKGRDPSRPSVILLAHTDVVPVSPDTEAAWAHPPFSGAIADGHIWGRGAMDFKLGVVGLLEAAEHLLGDGFVPSRTIHLAFGHDEEVGGERGARVVASHLAARGVSCELALDEGMAIVDGIIKEVERPVALIGIAEKGYASVALRVSTESGHSSMPPPRSAIGTLSRALVRIEENPMAARLDGPAALMFERLGTEMSFGRRLIFANLWLFGGLVVSQLEKEVATNAMVRTTAAPTLFSGGRKQNVLPTTAAAVVNFRIRPGDSPTQVLEHVRALVSDLGVEATPVEGVGSEPSLISSVDAPGFALVERTIREIFPTVLVAPSLVLGGTDSRHYGELCEQVYRFAPMVFQPSDRARLHGIDERMGTADFADAVRFYIRLMQNLAG